MSEKFEFLEHTADVKFQAFGKTVKGVFENSALALLSAITELEKLSAEKKVQVRLKGENLEMLLHAFLEEIVFQASAKGLVFKQVKVLELNEKVLELKAELQGQEINEGIEFESEVKAVTWNEFFLKKENGKWIAQVVLDV